MLLLYFREKRQIRVKKKFTPSTGFGGGKPKKKRIANAKTQTAHVDHIVSSRAC